MKRRIAPPHFLMRRTITMIFIGVVEAVTSAEEQAANGKQDGQDWQNYFEIEHIFKTLNKMTLDLYILVGSSYCCRLYCQHYHR